MHMMRAQRTLDVEIIDENMLSETDFPLFIEVDDEEGKEEIEEVVLNKESFRVIHTELSSGKIIMRNDGNMPLKLRKLSKILERPICSKRETQTFVIMVKVNGQKAIALLDLGCTNDTVMLELTRIVGL